VLRRHYLCADYQNLYRSVERLVAEELAGKLPIARLVEVAKESSASNAADGLLDRLAEECDWVITAVGD
jgi:hypothetical protein